MANIYIYICIYSLAIIQPTSCSTGCIASLAHEEVGLGDSETSTYKPRLKITWELTLHLPLHHDHLSAFLRLHYDLLGMPSEVVSYRHYF